MGFGRLLGLTARRMLGIARGLDVTTVPELEAAIAAGRLKRRPGVGPKTESKIRAALAVSRRRRVHSL